MTDRFDVNLNNPWFSEIIEHNQGRLIVMAITEVLSSARVVLVPYLIALVFEQADFYWLAVLWLGIIVTDTIFQFGYGTGVKMIMITKRSFQHSIEKHILHIDPIYNSMRSTGSIISQVNAGINAIESLVYGAFYNSISFVGLLLGSLIILSRFGWEIVIGGLFLMVFQLVFATFGSYINTKSLKKEYISARKNYFGIFTENIIQSTYIRSLFGVGRALEASENARFKYIEGNYQVQRGDQLIRILSFALQGLGLCLLSWYVWNSSLSAAVSLSVIFALFQVTSRLRIIGKVVAKSMEELVEVEQMFESIARYGKQSYPVTD